MIAHVVPAIRLPRTTTWFDYQVDMSIAELKPGTLVTIPFRHEEITGIVLTTKTTTTFPRSIKPITATLAFTNAYTWYTEFIPKFASEYSIGYSHVALLCLPEKPKRTVQTTAFVPPKPFFLPPERTFQSGLLKKDSLQTVREYLYTYLSSLHRLAFLDQYIQSAIDTNKSLVIFFPTQDTLAQYYYSLPKNIQQKIHVISSGMNKTQTWDSWTRAHQPGIYLATRMAVFWPFAEDATYIIDQSERIEFKQTDQNPRYSLIDILNLRLSLQTKINILYTCFTPKVEQYTKVQKKLWGGKTLQTKPKQQLIHVITDQLPPQAKLEVISKRIIPEETTFIYANRKGSFLSWYCRDCSWYGTCPHDTSPLRVYSQTHSLVCNECGYTTQIPALCPTCHGTNLNGSGIGTQNIESWFKKSKVYPKILRLDSDAKIIGSSSLLQPMILIGTEFVVQKIPFNSLDRIIVPFADSWLQARHFRSSEYAFWHITYLRNLLKQNGELLLYTRQSDHPFWQRIVQPYHLFWQATMKNRKRFGYPPYSILTKIVIPGPTDAEAIKKATQQKNELVKKAPAKLHTIGNVTRNMPYHEHKKYYYALLIKSKNTDLGWLSSALLPGCFIDRNPETV